MRQVTLTRQEHQHSALIIAGVYMPNQLLQQIKVDAVLVHASQVPPDRLAVVLVQVCIIVGIQGAHICPFIPPAGLQQDQRRLKNLMCQCICTADKD